MRSRWGRLVWVLAGLLALTGCTQPEADGAEPPTVTQSPQETVEPTSDAPGDDGSDAGNEDPPVPPEVEAPERPAAMDEETVDGAIAAAKYFVNLYPYVYASGNTDEWEQLSDDGCGFCSNVQERANRLHSDGGFSIGGAVEISTSDGGGPYEDEVYTVELGVVIESSEFIYPDGTRTSYAAIEDPNFILSMHWEDSGWRVLGVLAGEDS